MTGFSDTLDYKIIEYEKRVIEGKNVYIVCDHATALLAWADVRCTLQPPLLITLDHHTDTMVAFRRLYANSYELQDNSRNTFTEKHVHQINYTEPATVLDAVAKLQNDEHIDAAIRAGIIESALVICNGDSTETFIDNQHVAARKMLEVCPLCLPICTKQPHDHDCVRLMADSAIEDVFLNECLKIASELRQAKGVVDFTQNQFILDIDLDYFCTRKAIEPKEMRTFYGLIRGAHAITIATEPDFVEVSRLNGEEITSETLLPLLLDHIKKALRELV